MAHIEPDEESIPRYKRGYEWFSHLANTCLSRKDWRRLGFFSFYDAPYAESNLLYLSPKQVMLTMAKMAKKKENGLVLVVDAMEKDEIGIRVTLGRGDAAVELLTCDLSYDYVRINAEYRT